MNPNPASGDEEGSAPSHNVHQYPSEPDIHTMASIKATLSKKA